MFRYLLIALGATVALGQWTTVHPPARPGSGMPNFTRSPGGDLYLSWIDPASDKHHALRFAKWNGASWNAPETISEGANWFVNWADFPSLAIAKDGSMLAHWLARLENGGQYGYGIRIAGREADGQRSWRHVAGFNPSDPADYAGFLSFAANGAAYLAPPVSASAVPAGHQHGAEEHQRKTLRFATFGNSGQLIRDIEVDDDVCSCCPTASAEIPSGVLIAYRDHLPGEIRDISVIRITSGKANSPEVLHRDGWKINGCPTEGPSVAASGNSVGIAWMTRADGTPRLQVAWSQDGGVRFRAPVVVDDGNPLGRPHLVAVDEHQSLLVWLEKNNTGAEIRVRRVASDGRVGSSMLIAKVAASRTTGLPRIAVYREQVLVAWREGAVRVGWLPLASVPQVAR
jgi:hypothetical protein